MKISIIHNTKTHSHISNNIKVPTDKDIKKEVSKLNKELNNSNFYAGIHLGFTEGAKWMREQLLKDLLK